MQISSRFTIAVHAIICIEAFKDTHKVTSEFIASSVQVNPVVIRRLLQQLQSGGDFYDRYAGGYARSINLNPLWLGLCAASICSGGRCLPFILCC